LGATGGQPEPQVDHVRVGAIALDQRRLARRRASNLKYQIATPIATMTRIHDRAIGLDVV
jgi:hypothetical protein